MESFMQTALFDNYHFVVETANIYYSFYLHFKLFSADGYERETLIKDLRIRFTCVCVFVTGCER